MSALRTHFRVPTPGELVSPISGSAIVTWARAIGATHIASVGSGVRRLLTGDGELVPRAAPARARTDEISMDRQLARLTEWLGQWEAA